MKVLLILFGTLCVALGVLGIILPVLPTTPFLLLAAICYARSSERLHHWLMTNRWFGAYLRNYQERRGIPRKQKVFAILLVWLTIGSTAWMAAPRLWVRFLLLAVAVGITVYLLRMKTNELQTQPYPLDGELDS